MVSINLYAILEPIFGFISELFSDDPETVL